VNHTGLRSFSTEAELFAYIAERVSSLTGVQLAERQRAIVENRIVRRLRETGCASIMEYANHFAAHESEEIDALTSLLTTHHTYFFREFSHFEFLLETALPQIIEHHRKKGLNTIRIWSAACSRGQEVYSLAMFLQVHLNKLAPDFNFKIMGSDVDPESVKIAKNGVYSWQELKSVPVLYMQNQWQRGSGDIENFVSAKPSLRRVCEFRTINLQDLKGLTPNEEFDVIFCRNVFIYFSRENIAQISAKLLQRLSPAGHLYIGLSESLNGLGLECDWVGPSVYAPKKAQAVATPTTHQPAQAVSSVVKAPIVVPNKAPIRVVCVDDSKTVLSILKRVLDREHGFEVVGVAHTGREAVDVIARLKPDIVTMDIHMPEMTGPEYMEKHFGANHPPVIMVSSVNREETSLAAKCLSLGASDYVEKPTLDRMATQAEEIRAKIKTVLSAKKAKSSNGEGGSGPQGGQGPSSGGGGRSINSSGQTRVAKVLIVDDSPTIRQMLKSIVSQSKELEVVGEAERPSQVKALIQKLKPDVMTLDINMPEMTGVQLLRELFVESYVPTVMISSISLSEGHDVLDALELGAVDYIQKPSHAEITQLTPVILEKLSAAAKSKRSRVSARGARRARQAAAQIAAAPAAAKSQKTLIAIGASTGGTEAIRHLLELLPNQIPPIVVVQHIPPVFSEAFAKRLNDLFEFEVREAADGDEVRPNRVLIAPGGRHMRLERSGARLIVRLNDDPPVNRFKPSVDVLFQSVAKLLGREALGVLLTGMGSDGARGLLEMRRAGSQTFAQDEESCVVFGMPRAAIELGAAAHVKSIDGIAQSLAA